MSKRTIGLFALGLIISFAAAFAEEPALEAEPAAAPKRSRLVRVSMTESNAQPAAPETYIPSATGPAPSPVEWNGNCATLGSVQLDAATKTVTATGWVNQTEGLIEVLACGPGGKVHESVFVLALNPLDLQAALLLTGVKGGKPMPAVGESPPEGDPIDVIVEWEADGGTRTARAESFVWNIEEDAVLPETPWTFTGSIVRDGEFKALAEESLVVTYWDPYAIVNLPLPCGINDELLVVNSNTVPPYQTPVKIHFSPKK